MKIHHRGWIATLKPEGRNTRVEFDIDPRRCPGKISSTPGTLRKQNHLVKGQDYAPIERHIKACIDTYTGNVQYVTPPSAYLNPGDTP